MSKAFDKIAGGLREAITIARGEARPFKLHVPHEIDVRSIRDKLGMTQDAFASSFGFSPTQIRDWEQGRSRPLGGVRAYLMIIDQSPEAILAMLRKAQETKAA
jgi:putative transcriptional regulator